MHSGGNLTSGAFGIRTQGPISFHPSFINNIGTLAAAATGAGSGVTYRGLGVTVGTVSAADAFTATSGISTNNGALLMLAEQAGAVLAVNAPINLGTAQANLQSGAFSAGVPTSLHVNAPINAGNVILTANEALTVNAPVTAASVSLGRASAAGTIYVGAGTTPGGLGISNATIANITASSFGIGNTNVTGDIQTDGAVVIPASVNGPTTFTTVGQNITLNHDVTGFRLGFAAGSAGATGAISGSGRVTSTGIGTTGFTARQGINLTNPANSMGIVSLANTVSGDIVATSACTPSTAAPPGRRLDVRHPGPGRVCSPTIAAGRVYIGSNDGRLYVLDLATGNKRTEWHAGAALSASPAIAGARLVIGAHDGRIYCLG